MKRKAIRLLSLYDLVIGLSALHIEVQEERPKNLKYLPKNISHEELDSTMKSFNMALGVKCNHCHAPKPNVEKGLDFASDANPKKNIARHMIKMTKQINKKHFNRAYDGVVYNISCNTCHNGKSEAFTVVKQ